MALTKRSLDEWLDSVSYAALNDGSYIPSEFALAFMNFVKMVNGAEGESHKTPPVHLKMLDKIAEPGDYIANLCFRGAGKTALFGEYFFLFLAMFCHLPGFGPVTSAIYISDSMENGVKSLRKNMEFRYNNSEFLKQWIPKAVFTDNYIEFTNIEGQRFGLKMFGAKTGLRGTKIFGKRPTLAILDDLVSDDDSKSKAAMSAIKDTVYKGVDYALDPVRRKIVFNGTPFNKGDILYEAVESGGWDVNVWPICERFPCTREEFRGAWAERFSFDFVQEQYDMAVATGQVSAFMQELMLRITSEEDRLVQSAELRWYPRTKLLANRSMYNFYITTDWATSDKQDSDWSVLCVWAYNNNGDWFLVDMVRHQKTMDKTLDELFHLVAEYRPMSVGVEVTGQQGGFVPWMQERMIDRNCFFTFASSGNGNNPGIRPATNKLTRFNMAVPLFKTGKIYFPEELRTTSAVHAMVEEVTNATPLGFKTKNDDCADNVSQLPLLKAWRPSEEAPQMVQKDKHWDMDQEEEETQAGMSNYVV